MENLKVNERHKPVYKICLHIQTMNYEVSEGLLIQRYISNKTWKASQSCYSRGTVECFFFMVYCEIKPSRIVPSDMSVKLLLEPTMGECTFALLIQRYPIIHSATVLNQ